MKVIPSEECVQQHQLMVCDFHVRIPKITKRKFTPRLRIWKLKDDAVTTKFRDTFIFNLANFPPIVGNHTDNVEDVWSKFKDPLLQTASEVCGFSKNHQWRPET